MEQKANGRTFWDVVSDQKTFYRFCIIVCGIIMLHFLVGIIFRLDFKVSFKELSYGFTKREKSTNTTTIADTNIVKIDSLVFTKYLPLINNIYRKAANSPADENQRLRNEYIIENTKLIKLLNLKSEITQGKQKDSVTQKIYLIENN